MANISILSRLVNGVSRNVDLSTNTLVVQALSTGTNTLTDAILGRLLALQNGTDVGTGYHTHDGVYTRTTALSSVAVGTAGSTLIGDNNSYANISPATATVKGALSALDSALGTAANALDGTFRIKNTAAPTKQIAFSAASITTGQTRTITMPDADVNLGKVASAIQADGSVAHAANQSMGGFLLTNLATAIAGTDAVNLAQLQQYITSIDWKQHVRAMSDSNITLSGTQTVDGVALIATDRILVNGQTTQSANGIYVVAAGAWTRATDADSGPELVGATVFVDEGTNYKGSAWTQTTAAPFTVGTSNAVFVKFGSISSLVYRNGLLQTGQNIDVVAGDNSLTSTTGSLVVKLPAAGALAVGGTGIVLTLESANPTLAITSSALGVKLDAARAITTGASGVGVNVDNVTLAIATNALKIKPSGVSSTEIATSVADQATLTGGAGTTLTVQYAPAIKATMVAGQSFSANTTYAVRWSMPINGETAGRVYAADPATATYDLFYVIGLFVSGSAVTAGQSITVTKFGIHAIGSSDTAFTTNQVGTPVFMTTAGAITLTAPSTSGAAVTRVGIVSATNQIDVSPHVMGVN